MFKKKQQEPQIKNDYRSDEDVTILRKKTIKELIALSGIDSNISSFLMPSFWDLGTNLGDGNCVFNIYLISLSKLTPMFS